MENITNQYELLLDKLYLQGKKYTEKDIAIFTPAKGTKYQQKLMVVGRAVNGWILKIDKNNTKDIDRCKAEIGNVLKNSNLNWVNDLWGKTENKYNTKKSAFWRITKRIAAHITPAEKQDVVNTIVWSNLYKAANWHGGNPSTKLINLEYDNCLEILKQEIELYKPERIVFLTGYQEQWWAKPFLDRLHVTNILQKPIGFVEFAGVYNNIKIVVGQHPQGRNENIHLKNILDALALVTQSQSEIE